MSQPIESLLGAMPDFDQLSEQDRRAFVAALEPRHFSDGDTIIRQGKRGDGAHLLVSGTVRVTLDREGETIALGEMEVGELFGLLAMIDHRPRSASCVAVGPVETAFLSRPAFELLAHRHANIAYPLQRAIAGQVAADFRDVVSRIRGRMNG